MKMKSSFPAHLLLLLFLSSAVFALWPSVIVKSYVQYPNHRTWEAARALCKSHYVDLAYLYYRYDSALIYNHSYFVWGEQSRSDDVNATWKWSDGTPFQKNLWAHGEPEATDTCGLERLPQQSYHSAPCDSLHFFLCWKNDLHYLVPELKKQNEVFNYCTMHFQEPDDPELSEDFPAWIGLHRDGDEWKWSTGLSDFGNMTSNLSSATGDCVTINVDSKEMSARDCSTKLPFVCFYDNLILVKENKTWDEALDHCRAFGDYYDSSNQRRPILYNPYDLLSVQPGDDFQYKLQEATTDEVWVGLRFLAGQWMWVNGMPIMYPLPSCPVMDQLCGVLTMDRTADVETRDCMEKKNFFCYKKRWLTRSSVGRGSGRNTPT